MPWHDQLPGGLADDRTPADFDFDAMLKGLRVEMEHTSDRSIALEIVLDHLTEDPEYYDKLAEMEGDETEASDVRRAPPRTSLFVEGEDPLMIAVESVAGELFSRGAMALGDATVAWLGNAQRKGTV